MCVVGQGGGVVMKSPVSQKSLNISQEWGVGGVYGVGGGGAWRRTVSQTSVLVSLVS